MKAKIVGLAVCVIIGCSMIALAAENRVRVGDTYEEVIDALGTPRGVMETESLLWLRYARGTVKLREDRVVEVDLLDPAEAARRAMRDREEWDRIRRWDRERFARLAAEAAAKEERDRVIAEQRNRISELELRMRIMERDERRRSYANPIYVARETVYPVVYTGAYPVRYSTGGWSSQPVYRPRSCSASYLDGVYGGMSVMSTPGYRRSSVQGSVRIGF